CVLDLQREVAGDRDLAGVAVAGRGHRLGQGLGASGAGREEGEGEGAKDRCCFHRVSPWVLLGGMVGRLGSRNETRISAARSWMARASRGLGTSFMRIEKTIGFCPGAP